MNKYFFQSSEETYDDLDDLSSLKLQKLSIAKKLNINSLVEPRQQKRIVALFKLLKKYIHKSDVKSYLYHQIIENADKLLNIYQEKLKNIANLKETHNSNEIKEKQLNLIHYKNHAEIKKIEEEIKFFKQLIYVNENKFSDKKIMPNNYSEALKEIDEKCFDNWLKLLDINCELRNTIIGFENRTCLYKVSNAFINYYLYVESKLQNIFQEIKNLKKQGVEEYYEKLRYFSLPNEKLLNFQMFLQKKIESKLHESLELKIPFGNAIDYDYKQIDNNVDEIKKQHEVSQDELISIINYYKESLLEKQSLFVDKIDNLIKYLKERYADKIDQLYSKLQNYQNSFEPKDINLSKKNIELLMHLETEEFNKKLDILKIKYSKILIPLMDSFSKSETLIENEYARDPTKLDEKFVELKKLKNSNISNVIADFEKEKSKLDELLDDKRYLINDLKHLSEKKIQKLTGQLKEECERICCDILKINQRFWAKLNAEFNSEARKQLIKLYYEYSPWIHVWNAGSKPWMHDYLIINLNKEYLKAVGMSLKNFSPESDFYDDIGDAMFQFNEYMREVYKNRDLLEYEQLIKLNTIPVLNNDKLLSQLNEKLLNLKEIYDKYTETFNNFCNCLLNN